jgi:thioesterase domain-containing protein/aryl carrier-like protein
VRDHVRDAVTRVLGGGSTPGDLENLIESGLDSLRAVQLLADVGRATGMAFAVGEFVTRPTIADFAAFVHQKLVREPESTSAASPLFALRRSGSRPPLFCFHPAGGEITAYTRLRTLLGDEQPVFAVQSRGLIDPIREHASIGEMARDYAELVRSEYPKGSVRLLGWSLGGLVAHAVAAELERAGHPTVDGVFMIDVPRPGGAIAMHPAAMAIAGIVYDTNPRPPTTDDLFARLRQMDLASDSSHLLRWCRESGLISEDMDLARFDATLRLYRAHADMVAGHAASTIRGEVHLFWAADEGRNSWPTWTTGTRRENVLGGTHYTVIREPAVKTVVAAVEEMSRRERTG